MSIHEDRLRREHTYMEELRRASSLIDFVARGNPPDDYLVTFHCHGMIAADRMGSEHVAQIYLHAEFPRQPPQVTILTPSFHPNIAAAFQTAPFQARLQDLLAKAPDEQARLEIAQQVLSDERLFRCHVCLDTLDRNWSPKITLDLITIELGELLQYKRYNVDDPLNHEAAEWTVCNRDRLPIDRRNLMDLRALHGIRILEQEAGGEQELALHIIAEEETRVWRRDR
jgi:ubiquitin-protein ligase